MRILNSIEAMAVAGGRTEDERRKLLEEVLVHGSSGGGAPWAHPYVVGAGNGEAWSGMFIGERGGGGGGGGGGDEEIIDVKIPKPDFCVDGLFLSKNADPVNLNVNWQKAFQYMSAQQLNELAATLQSIKTGTFPASGTGGWQAKLPTGTPQSLLDNMMKEAREAAKLSPENRWAYGGNFGDLLTNGMKAYTYVPWLNLQPQLAKIFGKSCNQSA